MGKVTYLSYRGIKLDFTHSYLPVGERCAFIGVNVYTCNKCGWQTNDVVFDDLRDVIWHNDRCKETQ
jgi:hypothetical protein